MAVPVIGYDWPSSPPNYATPAPIDPPEGEPADADTVEADTATAMELYACLNANDFMRAFSLFTDDALVRGFMDDGYTQETFVTMSTPTAPMPTEAWVALKDVTVLNDGHIGAIVVERIPDSSSDDYRIYRN